MTKKTYAIHDRLTGETQSFDNLKEALRYHGAHAARIFVEESGAQEKRPARIKTQRGA